MGGAEKRNITVSVLCGQEPEPNHDVGNLQPGHVFTVIEHAAQISNMTMVVIAITGRQEAECLALSHHGDYAVNEQHRDKHLKVYEENDTALQSEPTAIGLEFKRLDVTLKLRQDVWISCERVYTVKEVGFRYDGNITNLRELLKFFREVQNKMYNAVIEGLPRTT